MINLIAMIFCAFSISILERPVFKVILLGLVVWNAYFVYTGYILPMGGGL